MLHDVAVVGAGPAGAWAAFLLARGGARVLLLDPSHPREKPCGGGVTGRALALVRPALPPLPAVTIRRARFLDAGTGTSAAVDLPGHGSTDALVVTGRAAFDGLLLQAAQLAGAELVAERATDVRRAARGFEIETADGRTHAAPLIVGADGANSLVRRRLARPFTRSELSIATGFFLHGATSDEILLEFVADPSGYIWSFPRQDHLAVGICAAANTGVTAAALRARARQWIARTGIGAESTVEPYSWPIPSLGAADVDRLAIAGPGWYLVGDAAGVVDPITREGIFFALQSASLAADAIAGSRPSGERGYVDRMQVEILSELRRAARIKDLFFNPRFTRLLLDALGRSERIRVIMADLIAGTQGYRDLKWRLARTFEFGDAIKAFRSMRVLGTSS
jgi:geranylgeranyl reductase family protein